MPRQQTLFKCFFSRFQIQQEGFIAHFCSAQRRGTSARSPAMAQSNLSYLTPGDPLEFLQSLRKTAPKSGKKCGNPPKISDQVKRNIKIMNWNVKKKTLRATLTQEMVTICKNLFVNDMISPPVTFVAAPGMKFIEHLHVPSHFWNFFFFSSLCLSQGQHKGLDELGQNSQHFWILSRSLHLSTQGCFSPSRQKALT